MLEFRITKLGGTIFILVVFISAIVTSSQAKNYSNDPRHNVEIGIGHSTLWNNERCWMANAPQIPSKSLSRKIIRCLWGKRSQAARTKKNIPAFINEVEKNYPYPLWMRVGGTQLIKLPQSQQVQIFAKILSDMLVVLH